MAAKSLLCSGVETGSTVYAMVRREADGFLLNDADGAFAAAPADPYLALTEHATILGLFTASESRTTWDDGLYTVYFYDQSGASPDPSADSRPVASGPMVVRDDAEVTLGGIHDDLDAVDTSINALLGRTFGTKEKEILKELAEIKARVQRAHAQILDLEKQQRRR